MAGFLAAELVGRIGQPAKWNERERRYLTFSVAHNVTAGRNGVPPEVLWVSCIWFDAPPKIAEYLTAGTEVFVRGRLLVHTYRTSQEETKVSLDITVSELKILHTTSRKNEDGGQQAADPSSAPLASSEVKEQDAASNKTFYRDF